MKNKDNKNHHRVFKKEKEFFIEARENMVKNQILPVNVKDHRILEAMLNIQRQLYVNNKYLDIAYLDKCLHVESDRYTLEPSVLARMIEALQLTEHSDVMDIGCGYGYSTEILANISQTVYCLENSKSILAYAENHLRKLRYENIEFIYSDFHNFNHKIPPIDAILINGVFESRPSQLLDLLKPGGRMTLIEKSDGQLKAVIYRKQKGEISRKELFQTFAYPLVNI